MNIRRILSFSIMFVAVFSIVIVGLYFNATPAQADTAAQLKLKLYIPPSTARSRPGVAGLHNRNLWRSVRGVFKHKSCTNCHKIGRVSGKTNADKNQYVKDALDSDYHPGNVQNDPNAPYSNSACATCHNRVLTGINSMPTPVIDNAWQAAPTGQDFGSMGDSTICGIARRAAVKPNARNHLKSDSLILWAIVGGDLPRNRPSAQAAYSRGILYWRELIDSWVLAGMPCR